MRFLVSNMAPSDKETFSKFCRTVVHLRILCLCPRSLWKREKIGKVLDKFKPRALVVLESLETFYSIFSQVQPGQFSLLNRLEAQLTVVTHLSKSLKLPPSEPGIPDFLKMSNFFPTLSLGRASITLKRTTTRKTRKTGRTVTIVMNGRCRT